MGRDHLVKETFFFQAHKIESNRLKIGIVELNSSWRSSQYDDDENRLLVAPSLFHQAIDCVRDCDLRFVLCHHPFEMLPEWNRSQIRRAMAKETNFLFTGHIHDSDYSCFQLMFGELYISTCAPLWSGRVAHGYSVVNLDLGKKEATVYLRKWYETRQVFDAETEKSTEGKVSYKNFMTNNPETNVLLEISELKSRLISNTLYAIALKPMEISEVVHLKDVFVEPSISEKSSLETSDDGKKRISSKQILESDQNFLVLGRREYGKSTFMRYLQGEFLKDNRCYENRIPVMIPFSRIPKNNVSGIKKAIRVSFNGILDEDAIDQYLKKGNFVFLIDDLNDLRDDARERRVRTLIEFHKSYPDCRFIFTMSEKIAQTFQQEAIHLYQEFKFTNVYLSSFNTAKIRELLQKWSLYRSFDVEQMLNQIVLFFQQLRIPITPMAVTLFIGVFFRDKGNKNITNEAYLIENYLEALLEKLDPKDSKSDFGFRDKESFLAHVAFRMAEKRKYHWAINEFEQEKLTYFNDLGEDIPDPRMFDAMFEKGILDKSGGEVRFSLKFCFDFFLAKAMQKDTRKKDQILGQQDYLKFSTAFSYKAGLDRNDDELANEIDRRVTDAMHEVIEKYKVSNFDIHEIESGLIEFGDKVAQELRKKNKAEEKDPIKDKKYLDYDEDDQEIEQRDQYDDALTLITLYSDIIRNTTDISLTSKVSHIEKDVKYFICIMWVVLDVFKEFIENTDEEAIHNLLHIRVDGSEKADKLVEMIKQFVLQYFPASIINYLADHLTNSKLKNATKQLLEKSSDSTEQLFYMLLLLKLDLHSALPFIKSKIKSTKSLIIDSIISISLRIHCYENEINNTDLDEIIKVLQDVRDKYPKKAKELPMPIHDTFASDFRESVRIKRASK